MDNPFKDPRPRIRLAPFDDRADGYGEVDVLGMDAGLKWALASVKAPVQDADAPASTLPPLGIPHSAA